MYTEVERGGLGFDRHSRGIGGHVFQFAAEGITAALKIIYPT
jgi:hypothetical protein